MTSVIVQGNERLTTKKKTLDYHIRFIAAVRDLVASRLL